MCQRYYVSYGTSIFINFVSMTFIIIKLNKRNSFNFQLFISSVSRQIRNRFLFRRRSVEFDSGFPLELARSILIPSSSSPLPSLLLLNFLWGSCLDLILEEALLAPCCFLLLEFGRWCHSARPANHGATWRICILAKFDAIGIVETTRRAWSRLGDARRHDHFSWPSFLQFSARRIIVQAKFRSSWIAVSTSVAVTHVFARDSSRLGEKRLVSAFLSFLSRAQAGDREAVCVWSAVLLLMAAMYLRQRWMAGLLAVLAACI